jgi:adenosylhomocysteine nucleosidase
MTSVRDGDIMFVMAAEAEYGSALRTRIQPLITGVGPIEAAVSVATRLQQMAETSALPKLIVSLGSAGSLRHPVGSVWQVASVSWRDMDASRIGFPVGVTPFAGHAAMIGLATPLQGVPTASLSTGGDLLNEAGFQMLEADLADMETFAVLRAAHRFGIPVIGLRGVSDNPGDLRKKCDWEKTLGILDERLAVLVDHLKATDGNADAMILRDS